MRKLLILGLGVALLSGCASYNTRAFRAEKLASDTAVGGMKAWVAYYKASTNGAPEPVIAMLDLKANEINRYSKQFGTALAISEELRIQYGTNTTVKPMLDASLATMKNQSSNILWLVNQYMNPSTAK